MRIPGRRYRDEWVMNAYPSKQCGEMYMRVSRAGKLIMLTQDEENQLNEFFMEESLYSRLEKTGHIITAQNSSRVFAQLATWLRGTYEGPGLHIVVPTRRCNLNCVYCHMYPQPVESSKAETDLPLELVPSIASFIMSSPRPSMMVEFQGGEPFLNFPVVIALFEELRRLNSGESKQISFGLVSNLMVARDEDLRFCYENGIKISYSLNGPQPMHDLLRITRSGSGSHEVVMRRIDSLNTKFPGLLAGYPLCVITETNMTNITELADYYFSLGYKELGFILLKNLGNARGNVKLDMREFLPHYIRLLEHIYEKNRLSQDSYSERLVMIALLKIFSDTNPLFVDWRNPIGYISNCLIYNYDGEILPVDEARSFSKLFALGNVRTTTYEDLIRARSTYETVNLSIRDREAACRECSYNPYCGVSPVLNYAKTGSTIPKPHESDECLFVMAVFDWICAHLNADDPRPLLKMMPAHSESILKAIQKRGATDEAPTVATSES